jgi:hypothetical protein
MLILDCPDYVNQLELICKAVALITIILAWILLLNKRAVRHHAYPRLTYGPISQRD